MLSVMPALCRKTANQATEVAHLPALQINQHCGRLAQQVGGRNVIVGGQSQHVEGEEAAQFFTGRHREELERVFA